jgi:hypothetical protein
MEKQMSVGQWQKRRGSRTEGVKQRQKAEEEQKSMDIRGKSTAEEPFG